MYLFIPVLRIPQWEDVRTDIKHLIWEFAEKHLSLAEWC